MTRVLFINGPNLSRLGVRKPEIYGTDTLSDIERRASDRAEGAGISCVPICSNCEGAIIDFIDAHRTAEGLIINPGALMMNGWSLRDALEDYIGHSIEVHISNLWAREAFRHQSVLSAHVDGVIAGFGTRGYDLAMSEMVHRLKTRSVPSSDLADRHQ